MRTDTRRIHKRSGRWLVALLLGAGLVLAWPLAATAHPLGNFTINHYAGLHVRGETIAIDYVLDMAEIPAFQVVQQLDANGNHQPDAAEAAGYHRDQCAALRTQLELRVDQTPVSLTLVASAVKFPPGVGELLTLRLSCEFRASITKWARSAIGQTGTQVTFADYTYAERLGWREMVVTAEGVPLRGEFLTTSVSNRLVSYPNDLLSAPLDQRQVTFDILPLAASSLLPGAGPQAVLPAALSQSSYALSGRREDAFTELIALKTISLPTLLAALAIAVVWGGMHALTPGHGKTIVGAYLVGSRSTWKHALFLGLATTLTHTMGVFVLGGVTLLAAQFILPEQLYPWLGVLSGLLVVTIGMNLLVFRLRHVSAHTGGEHVHHHPHNHDHGGHGHHAHEPDPTHVHAHGHDHGHDHGLEPDAHGHAHLERLGRGADGSPVTWRSLLALGVSGGLLPCPSALVVLLSAVALERVGFGLVLVLAFSLGLAGVLTGIGLLFLYAGQLFGRLPMQSRMLGWLPVASALFITLAGLGVTLQALLQTELIRL